MREWETRRSGSSFELRAGNRSGCLAFREREEALAWRS